MEFDAKTTGLKIRLLIEEKSISKQKLSEEIGVSRQAVSQYCDGITIPNADKLMKIADFFNVSTDYLLGLKPHQSNTETPEIDFETLHSAINTYGKTAQENVAIEEMSELIKAIIKNRRYNNIKTVANIREEMADVYIMLQQLMIMYGGVSTIVNLKLQRLKQNLSTENCDINKHIESCEDCGFCEVGKNG